MTKQQAETMRALAIAQLGADESLEALELAAMIKIAGEDAGSLVFYYACQIAVCQRIIDEHDADAPTDRIDVGKVEG